MVHVSVMVYYTPAFKEQWSNLTINKIEAEIKRANRIFFMNRIPVHLDLFCTEELEGFVETENDNMQLRLAAFWFAKSKYRHSLDFELLGNFPELIPLMTINEATEERGVQAYTSLLNTADIGILMTRFQVSLSFPYLNIQG